MAYASGQNVGVPGDARPISPLCSQELYERLTKEFEEVSREIEILSKSIQSDLAAKRSARPKDREVGGF